MFENNAWYDKLPDENLEVYEPHLRLFFELMHERQLIWKRRFIDKKERPWTENKIFKKVSLQMCIVNSIEIVNGRLKIFFLTIS